MKQKMYIDANCFWVYEREENGKTIFWKRHHTAVVHESAVIGDQAIVYQFATIREGVVIGKNCAIGSLVYVGHNTRMGDNVRITDKSHITDHMIIEDDVFFGPMVVTMSDRYPRALNPTYIAETITIRHNASIGGGAVLLPGITIGEWAMVGAGAVVTRDVPPHVTIYGNPARVRLKDGPIRPIV